MNYALRMVIPMRREFGCSLDVQQFLHDVAYAQAILLQARQSQNPKLREYADHLDSRMRGPRSTAVPAVSKKTPDSITTAPTPSVPDANTLADDEEAARQLMLAKYRAGLR